LPQEARLVRRFKRFRIAGLRGLRWLVLLVAGGFLLLRLTDFLMVEPLTAVAETESRLRAAQAINMVVLGETGKVTKPADLVHYEKNQAGDIVAMNVNTALVNQIATEVATKVEAQIKDLSSSSFGVPIGALSRSELLATQGPIIPVKMIPVGTIIVDIKNSFQAAGINQTRHAIYLHASAKVRVVLPVVSREVEVTYEMPITETVILGKVPQFYGDLGHVTVPVGQ
jgi:sporulation protein YunB